MAGIEIFQHDAYLCSIFFYFCKEQAMRHVEKAFKAFPVFTPSLFVPGSGSVRIDSPPPYKLPEAERINFSYFSKSVT